MTSPGHSHITADDIYLFNEGNHFRLYEKLGARPAEHKGIRGTYFAVWAPNARGVAVVGDFNGWNRQANPLTPAQSSGIWEGFIPGIGKGELYKYSIDGQQGIVDKTDPFAFYCEVPPKSASVVWDLAYQWQDEPWTQHRSAHSLKSPMAIYEVHVGSWKRGTSGSRWPNYRQLAHELAEHVKRLGFTHVELVPIMEHPFYGSWGYQILNYYAPTSRYGCPQDFMYFVDYMHQQGIGVFLDWVPSHFSRDAHGLYAFDGTHLYEHADPRQGYHPDWGSHIFNYGRHEVRSFLISNALYWFDKFHVDGLRVDAVASMLYLDYSRKEGEWIPNEQGGKENLPAIHFIKRLNEVVYQHYPDVHMIAEESTAWPAVSRPTFAGGLGFGMKWDMGWMHDTLVYFSKDPIHRKHHHNTITFRMLYAFNENFVLPLSHDEVVHGKCSLLSKMPGDDWQQFSNLRLLYSYMYSQPGKKLLFMGAELGQREEWHHESELRWELMQYPHHRGLSLVLSDLNKLYQQEKALHEFDFEPAGFEWIDGADTSQSVLSFLRKGSRTQEVILIVGNFTPVPRNNYRIGVPLAGKWKEIFNSDQTKYGGSGVENPWDIIAVDVPTHGRQHSIEITLPPLGCVFLKPI
ncbi:MAG: 1,4-alpha-glucan branching protein GlgB [Deltaproteobacteria bacterium]|nr:1,4-alpha-glucan branching protein GlgB [Deltaproteobacteria bacterium]